MSGMGRGWMWSVLGIVQVVLTIALLCMGLIALKHDSDAVKDATNLNRGIIKQVQSLTQTHVEFNAVQHCALANLIKAVEKKVRLGFSPKEHRLVIQACTHEKFDTRTEGQSP